MPAKKTAPKKTVKKVVAKKTVAKKVAPKTAVQRPSTKTNFILLLTFCFLVAILFLSIY